MMTIKTFAVQSTEKLSTSQPADVAPTEVWGGRGRRLESKGGASTGGDGSMVKGIEGGVMM